MKIHLEAVAVAFLTQAGGLAQPPPPFTIRQAVQQAIDNYPAVRGSLEQVASAEAAVSLAKTAYLPRADLLAQVNRATRNNVFGLTLPQPVAPAISGPVLGTNSLTSVWGSAVGVLVSWEPFDFGLRGANIGTARSSRDKAEESANLTRLQVATAAADAFLTLLAARQSAAAVRAGVERAQVLERVTDSLANSGLRPGADAARARAEVALAQTRLIQAEQAVEVARVSLSQWLGITPPQAVLDPGPLLDPAPEAELASESLKDHPLARQQGAVVEQAKAAERALSRSYFPRFNLQAATYARGSGARTDGTTGSAFSGLGPNFQNWAVGMTMLFPTFDRPAIRARQEVETHRERAEIAQYDRILQDLEGEAYKARAQLAGARQVARNTPVQLDAARATVQQSTARYQAGLGSIVEVAEAQRLMTQAEMDDSLAKLSVWRGWLAVAAAYGDLQPFLQLAGK